MPTHVKQFDDMTPEEERAFVKQLTEEALRGDDLAAREHLAAGRPIHYCEENTPPGLLVKEHPDGRRELVRLENGQEIFVSTLTAPTAP